MSIEPIDDQQASDAEPAAERITLALIKAIGRISKFTGYWDDVKVTRPDPANPEPIVHACVEVMLQDEAPSAPVTGIEQIDATYYLTCDVVSPEAKAVSIDTLINRIKADVKKVVLKDRTLGGLAMDTNFDAAVLLDVDGSAHTGRVVLTCIVTYRTREEDPYALLTNPNPYEE